MNRCSLQYRHGTITDYAIHKKKHKITVYFSFYYRNKPVQVRFCRMKADRLYSKFRKLPIYRSDGTIDLSYLNGMRVSVKAVGWFRRIFVEEITLNLPWYGMSSDTN